MTKLAAAMTLVLLALALAVSASASAAPPGERCRTAKLSAIGVYSLGTLRCAARVVGAVAPAALACSAVAEQKLVRAFARAEQETSCPPTLASARAATAAFVASVLASAEPTPTPTTAPTPAPSPAASGCGNHVVEAGEQCDGQAFCTAECRFAAPTVCCGPTGFCLGGDFPTLADICYLQGVPYTLGAVCEPAAPACAPTAGCEGSCRPAATFAPTSICCELASGCTAQTIGDTVELWQFSFQGCLQAGGTAALGTCAASGNCLPGG